jgi:putative ABC transport system substrate-binding protein
MRRGELIASLAAMASASLAKLAPSHSSLSALDRCTRTCRVLAAVAVSLVSFAHVAATQDPVRRIGIIQGVPTPEAQQAFRDELHARGYDVGRNLQIEYRYTQAQVDRIPALVAEVVALRPDIIVATSPQAALVVRAAAPTIPFVFLNLADPVGLGLVPNLAHPGVT